MGCADDYYAHFTKCREFLNAQELDSLSSMVRVREPLRKREKPFKLTKTKTPPRKMRRRVFVGRADPGFTRKIGNGSDRLFHAMKFGVHLIAYRIVNEKLMNWLSVNLRFSPTSHSKS